ncbi:MAG: succinate--CoA ligase subunit alpha [Candidatus Diapherotrites archaeon]|nr:succinate--CoA ligase subunit alpha [Candidatus Diapherotrites archaeon]
MSILIDEKTKVIIQGMTGTQGRFHSKLMLEYGTKIVAGVTPGKAGQEVEGVPIFDSIEDALKEFPGVSWSCDFVPAQFGKRASLDALQNGLNVVIIAEGMPVHDTLEVTAFADKIGKIVIGPNCPGLISPGKSKLGIIPGHICKPGRIGIVSRSGTLTYELINELSRNGLGQSTVIGIGGDPVIGMNFIDALKFFAKDKDTDAVVVVGEIGGSLEEKTAEFLLQGYSKKVLAYVAGVHAPKGKKMGHAGAIISSNSGTAETKIRAFEKVGIKVAKLPSEIVKLLKQ